MNRHRAHRPPRPFALARRTPRTRPEAAAELVRAEYERDRLLRDLAMIEARRSLTLTQLGRVSDRVDVLQRMLMQDATAPAAAGAITTEWS